VNLDMTPIRQPVRYRGSAFLNGKRLAQEQVCEFLEGYASLCGQNLQLSVDWIADKNGFHLQPPGMLIAIMWFCIFVAL
jgi:hypothetical protein